MVGEHDELRGQIDLGMCNAQQLQITRIRTARGHLSGSLKQNLDQRVTLGWLLRCANTADVPHACMNASCTNAP